jgi:phosphatidylinositol 4-kinase
LQIIYDLITKLLSKEILDFLDDLANDVFASNVVRNFPYKTFSETLNLVMVSLLRQLVKSNAGDFTCVTNSACSVNCTFCLCLIDLPSPFIKEVQSFVRTLFLAGQTDLYAQNPEPSTEREDEEENVVSGGKCSKINRLKLNVQTNAACVDILVWATKDEYGKVNDSCIKRVSMRTTDVN